MSASVHPCKSPQDLGHWVPYFPDQKIHLDARKKSWFPGHSPDLRSGARELVFLTRTLRDAHDQWDTWWQLYCSSVFVETRGLTSRPLSKQLLFLQAKFPFHAQLTAPPTPNLLTFLQGSELQASSSVENCCHHTGLSITGTWGRSHPFFPTTPLS